MSTTKKGIKTHVQTGGNTVTSRAEIKDVPKVPTDASEGTAATVQAIDLESELKEFCLERPHHMSEDGDTKLCQIRGAIGVLSTLAAEGQSSNGLIEFNVNALFNMLSMIEDNFGQVLANIEAGSGGLTGASLLHSFCVDRPYHLSEDGRDKLRQLGGAITVMRTLAGEGQAANDLIEFDSDAFFHMLWMLEDKIGEVTADVNAGVTLVTNLRRVS